jgi:hypothetical protein
MFSKSAWVIACVFALLSQPLSGQMPQPRAMPTEEDDQAISEDSRASPDGRFTVAIAHKPHPQGDNLEEYTLELRSGSRVITSFPTTGHLLDVHWSPNLRLVAINNRRGNSGDYLWVLSLKDGVVVKRPDDRFDKQLLMQVEGMVRKRDPRATTENLNRYWLTSNGWRTASVLGIEFRIRYWGNIGTFDYDATAKVGRRLQLAPGTLTRLQD